MAQEMTGREGISLQNCLLTLLPVPWEEQGYVCDPWRYSCRSFHSANRRITYLSKAYVKPVPLHLIIRCTLFNGEHAAGSHLLSCGSLFLCCCLGFFFPHFGLNWEWGFMNGCGQKELAWSAPSHTPQTPISILVASSYACQTSQQSPSLYQAGRKLYDS